MLLFNKQSKQKKYKPSYTLPISKGLFSEGAYNRHEVSQKGDTLKMHGQTTNRDQIIFLKRDKKDTVQSDLRIKLNNFNLY